MSQIDARTLKMVACEQAPVGDSRVQSRANGMNRERSGEEGVCRGACRHSIDAAVPWYQLLVLRSDWLNQWLLTALRYIKVTLAEIFFHSLRLWSQARWIFFRPHWEPVCRLTHEKNIVLVVLPLINLTNDQVGRLNSRRISAISFSDVSSELENRAVENG